MDNMSLFGGQMSLGSIFGAEYAFEETPAPKKEKKAAKPKADKKEPKKTEKQKEITLPCKVYGGSFTTLLSPKEGESEVVDEKTFLSRLAEAGFEEVLSSARRLFIPEEAGTVYVVKGLYTANTELDTLLDFGENGIVFAYGEEKITFTKEDFPDVEEDELSLALLLDKAFDAFPAYKSLKVFYDVEGGVVIPLLEKVVSDKDLLEFPCTVNVNGDTLTFAEGDFEGDNIEALKKHISGEWAHPDVTIEVCDVGGKYYVLFSSRKASNVTADKKNKGAKTKKKEEKYPSNCVVYLCFNGYHQQLTPECFGGKDKFTKKMLVEYFKPKFAVFNSAEKVGNINCFYDEMQNRLSVDCTPGRRGAHNASSRRYDRGYDFEEREVYVSTEDGDDPLENCIVLESEYTSYLTKPGAVCAGKEILSRNLPFTGCKLFANATAAYIYAEVGEQKQLVEYVSKVPKPKKKLLDGIIAYFKKQMPVEAICQIMFDHRSKEFYIRIPEEVTASVVDVKASFPMLMDPHKEIIATIHSHNSMPAFFSPTDDAAELDQIGLFGVIGRLDADKPQVLLRAVYEGGEKYIPAEKFFEVS